MTHDHFMHFSRVTLTLTASFLLLTACTAASTAPYGAGTDTAAQPAPPQTAVIGATSEDTARYILAEYVRMANETAAASAADDSDSTSMELVDGDVVLSVFSSDTALLSDLERAQASGELKGIVKMLCMINISSYPTLFKIMLLAHSDLHYVFVDVSNDKTYSVVLTGDDIEEILQGVL